MIERTGNLANLRSRKDEIQEIWPKLKQES